MMKMTTVRLLACLLLLAASVCTAQIPADAWTGSINGVSDILDAELLPDGSVAILTEDRIILIQEQAGGGFTFVDHDSPPDFAYNDEPFFGGPSLAVTDNSNMVIASPRYDGLYWWEIETGLMSGSIIHSEIDIDIEWPIDVEYAGNGVYYLLAGAFGNDFTGIGYHLLCLEDSDNIVWESIVQQDPTYDGWPTDILAIPGDGCLVAGMVGANEWIGRFDADGQSVWELTSDGTWPSFYTNREKASHLVSLPDGSFLYLDEFGQNNNISGFGAVHIDADGSVIGTWLYYTGQIGSDPVFSSAAVHPDGSLLVLIRARLNGVEDGVLLNLSLEGDLIWQRPVRSPNYTDKDYARQLVVSPTLGPVVINKARGYDPHGIIEGSLFATVIDLDTPSLQSVWVTTSPHPGHIPLSVSANGGEFSFLIELTNDLLPNQMDFWVQAIDGDPGFAVEIAREYNLDLPLGTHTYEISQTVPQHVPPGHYEYALMFGDYPWNVDMQVRLTIEKLPGPQNGPFGQLNAEGWELTSDLLDNQLDHGAALPTEYAMTPVYPNPFNPTATVTVSLPKAAPLSVQVFDRTGRLAADLTGGGGGHFPAGEHQFTLDGSQFASGIYFVRATVPGQFDQIRKAVLIK